MMKNKSSLEVFGNSKLEFSNIRFVQFVKKVQKYLGEMIKKSEGGREWGKEKESKEDIVGRLDERIKMSSSKKEGI